MRADRILIATAVALSLGAAGCSGNSAPSATAGSAATTTAGTGAATNAPTQAASASPAAASGLYLRSWSEASDPTGLYFAVPEVISDGQVRYLPELPLTDQPSAIFTSPVARTLSPAGQASIVALAQADGLLGGASSFDCTPDANSQPTVGGAIPHFELQVDGVTHGISGACFFDQPTGVAASPAPGTWAAFNDFASHVANLSGWLGAQLGPQVQFVPTTLIVWTAPAADAWWGPFDAVSSSPSRKWPLSTPLASFGNQVQWSGVPAPDPSRCTLLSGPDVATLLAGVKGANDDTRFTDGATQKVIAIRIVMPGEPTDKLCGQ